MRTSRMLEMGLWWPREGHNCPHPAVQALKGDGNQDPRSAKTRDEVTWRSGIKQAAPKTNPNTNPALDVSNLAFLEGFFGLCSLCSSSLAIIPFIFGLINSLYHYYPPQWQYGWESAHFLQISKSWVSILGFTSKIFLWWMGGTGIV